MVRPPGRSSLLLLLSVSSLVLPQAVAQAGGPVVEAGPWTDPPRIAVEPGWTPVPTPWTVTFSSPAAASAALADGKASITWGLACEGHELRLQNATAPVPFEPGQPRVSGVAVLGLQAAAGTLGMEPLRCALTAAFSDTAGSFAAEASVPVLPVVDFVDALSIAAPTPRMAGPQKVIYYPLELSNDGNSRTRVTFELGDSPGGMWNAIVPEPVVLGPGAAATATFAVATPFHQGYNSGSATFILRALPSADSDAAVTGAPQDVEVHASTKGWYAPGPSPLLALAVLAGAALVLRRKAA